jgi:hypothetical protein
MSIHEVKIEMGKSKDTGRKPRHRKSRLLKKLRHSAQQVWRLIPGWVKTVIIGATLIITLLEGYPWLSTQENGLLDPNNALTEMWLVQNDGYIPVTNLGAICAPAAAFSRPGADVEETGIRGIGFKFDNFADYLGHAGTVTLPCFHAVGVQNLRSMTGSELEVEVTYAFYGLDFPILRRSQEFRFECVVGSDYVQHWIYKN